MVYVCIYIPTYLQTDRQAGRQADRQTDRRTYISYICMQDGRVANVVLFFTDKHDDCHC